MRQASLPKVIEIKALWLLTASQDLWFSAFLQVWVPVLSLPPSPTLPLSPGGGRRK